MKTHTKTLLAALSACGALVAGSADAELITNGGFETVDASKLSPFPGFSQFQWIDPTAGAAGTAFDSWVITGAINNTGNQYGVTGGLERTGSYALNLTSVGASPFNATQDLTTEVGKTYTVSYWVAERGSASNFLAQIDGVTKDSLGSGDIGAAYQQESFDFTATATSTALTFTLDATANEVGYYLDDVSVVLVPEPGSLALLGLGGLLIARRRRG